MSYDLGRPSHELCMSYLREACSIAKVPLHLVFSEDKRHAVVWCRWYAAKRLRQKGYTLPGIGLALGMHHSTIVHYLTECKYTDTPPALTQSMRPKVPPRDQVPLLIPRNKSIHDRRYNIRPPLLPSEFKFDPARAMLRRCG